MIRVWAYTWGMVTNEARQLKGMGVHVGLLIARDANTTAWWMGMVTKGRGATGHGRTRGAAEVREMQTPHVPSARLKGPRSG